MCHVYNWRYKEKKYETAVFTFIRDSRYEEERMNISNLANKGEKKTNKERTNI